MIFSYQDLVAGNGFVASIVLRSRVLVVESDDHSFWLYGVQPSICTGDKRGIDAVLDDFRTKYVHSIYDIAKQASSFDEFRDAVLKFLRQKNDLAARDWEIALHGVERAASAPERAEEIEILPSLSTPAINVLPSYDIAV